MKHLFALTLTAMTAGVFASTASAGVYSDAMGKCLVDATTHEDRVALVRWVFGAMAHHPAVKPLSSITAAQQTEIDKTMAAVLMNLLTEKCKADSQKAMKFEGPIAYQLSFEILGRVSMTELMTNPDVTASLNGLQKYVDKEKLEALGKGAADAAP